MKASMNFDRRQFLALSALGLATFASPSALAFADSGFNEGGTIFTEEMAIQLAQNTAAALTGNQNLSVNAISKIYDVSLGAIGYCISYIDDANRPSGYIVFDVTDPSLISEYCFAQGAQCPCSTIDQRIVTQSLDGGALTKTGSFSYQPGMPTSYDTHRSGTPDSGSWDDIFYSGDIVLNQNYQIIDQRYAPTDFISYPEPYIEAQTGTYACAVSALTCCAEFYIPRDLFYSKDIAYHYSNLWNYSKTEVVSNSTGAAGITYGSTATGDIGPALCAHCSNFGQTIYSSLSKTPTWTQLRGVIQSNNLAIFCCGINKNGSRVGHAMAVEGYLQLQQKGDSTSAPINILGVCDGWNAGIRYLNISYAKYTDTAAVLFSRM